MAMTPSARAAAIYAQFQNTTNYNKLSPTEKTQALATIQMIWGDGDLVYIQGNALVNTNDTGTVTSGAGAGGAVIATGIGTVS